MSKGLVNELKRIPLPVQSVKPGRKVCASQWLSLQTSILDLDERQMEFIETSGMIAAVREFGRMARQFAPAISAEDIYQAGRNVMTAVFIQLLMGLPVEVTPAIFGYSMLYPYTDNYLDDTQISNQTKAAFNQRFESRLKGESIVPANRYEEDICRLVVMIEGQWDRAQFPLVYASLLAIHSAQVRSLSLVDPGVSLIRRMSWGFPSKRAGPQSWRMDIWSREN